MPTRSVFFVSDRTGITAEMLGNSLLSQFEGFVFQRQNLPYVDTPDKVDYLRLARITKGVERVVRDIAR